MFSTPNYFLAVVMKLFSTVTLWLR